MNTILLDNAITKFNKTFLFCRKFLKKNKRCEGDIVSFIDFLISYLNSGATIQRCFEVAVQKKNFETEVQNSIINTLAYFHQGYSFRIAIETVYKQILKQKRNKYLALLFNGLAMLLIKGSQSSSLLQKIKEKIEDEIQFLQKLKVITAQMTIQANVILFSPLVLSLILLIISPDHIYIFFESFVGISILIFMVCLNILGWFSLRKILAINQ